MKKVTSILAVAVMAVGMASMSSQNISNEIETKNDVSKTFQCDDCDAPLGDRIPPKKIA
ncbi:hypothetical protein VBZ51_10415 [Maribacter sp. HS]|uniref:hypothetical protein n=1 Tax=Maribacter sp. HS TaxID=3110480 RepID=UPI003A85264F